MLLFWCQWFPSKTYYIKMQSNVLIVHCKTEALLDDDQMKKFKGISGLKIHNLVIVP